MTATPPPEAATETAEPRSEAEIRADERARIRRRYVEALEADSQCGYAEAFGIAVSEYG